MSNNLEPELLFGIPVWDDTIDIDDELRSYLTMEYSLLAENTPGAPKFEARGWVSENMKYVKPLVATKDTTLHELVSQQVLKCITNGYQNRMGLELSSYVINVNTGDSYIKKNMAPGRALFTTTYFLTAPDSDAHLVFYNGYPYINEFMETLQADDYTLTHPVVHYEPKVGRCITYPSWLPTSMLPGTIADKRITIDFHFRSI